MSSYEDRQQFNSSLVLAPMLASIVAFYGIDASSRELVGAKVSTKTSGRTSSQSTPMSLASNGLPASFFEHGATCDRFITGNGSYGEYGDVIKSDLESTGPQTAGAKKQKGHFNENGNHSVLLNADLLAKDPAMVQTCPGIAGFDSTTLMRFWVWSFAAIAWDESKCGLQKQPTPSTNGICVGVMQINEREKQRDWRGPSCVGSSQKISQDKQNLLCSLDIMAGQFNGTYGKPGGLRKSYWEKLRKVGANDNIKKRIKEFPGCERKVELKYAFKY